MGNDKTQTDRLTARLQAWLDAPEGTRDMTEAADLVLRLTRNRILAANMARRGAAMEAKAVYELRKHLAMRLDRMTAPHRAPPPRLFRMTAAGVRAMERELMPRVAAATAARDVIDGTAAVRGAGKRPDHDSLPDDIRALWDENEELWRDIRRLFYTLKDMDDAPACDRYEYLKMLDQKEKRHRRNFERYDKWQPATEGAQA